MLGVTIVWDIFSVGIFFYQLNFSFSIPFSFGQDQGV